MSAAAGTVLQQILGQTREEVERRKREIPVETLEAVHGGGGSPAARGFRDALGGDVIGVIAEFKRRSPSAGVLRERPEVSEMLSAYSAGGAAAASILTEGPHFDGALEDLRTARESCELPLLRKDFIVDRYQLHEARAAGADAVLLIVAALEDPDLELLHATALGLGLDVLVEVHDRGELDRALVIGAEIIGVNNRDLRDFSVDVDRTERLMADMPAGVAVVSESGITNAAQLRRLQERGVHAVLMGERLMRAADPASAIRQLRAAAAPDAHI